MYYNFEDEFVTTNEDTEELISENFGKHPEVQSGIWILTTHEWRYVFRKVRDLFDISEAIDTLLEYDNEVLSRIWINGKSFKISTMIEKGAYYIEEEEDE
jgi:hypothetical protein